jgi:hypothetical protein
MRDIYDRFLAKFPLFFGYWKKYADLEFSIAGTEAAEMVLSGSPVVQRQLTDQSIGVRAWRCKHRKLRGPLVKLLLLQNRYKS